MAHAHVVYLVNAPCFPSGGTYLKRLHPSLGRASTRVSLRAPRGASRLPGVEGRERLG